MRGEKVSGIQGERMIREKKVLEKERQVTRMSERSGREQVEDTGREGIIIGDEKT